MKKNYEAVSLIYEHMMREIDYNDWALYIYDLIYGINKKPKAILELGSGSCKFANAFLKYHKNFIASDLSVDMLNQSNNDDLAKVVCDMTSLPFKTKYDFVISAFDSVNYLMSEKYVKKLFYEVGEILTDKGCFIFDVCLENNSLNYVKELNRKGKIKGIKYKQESIYDNIEKIHYNKFNIILNDGTKIQEEHKQKIYDFFFYFEAAVESGLFVKDCYECFSFDDATSETERVQFVLRKF